MHPNEVTLTTDLSGARVLPLFEDEAAVVAGAESIHSRLDVEEELVAAADFGRCRADFAIFAFSASAIINFSMSSPFVPFRGVRWEPRPVQTDTGAACVIGVTVGSLAAGVDGTGSSVADRRDCSPTTVARTVSSMLVLVQLLF